MRPVENKESEIQGYELLPGDEDGITYSSIDQFEIKDEDSNDQDKVSNNEQILTLDERVLEAQRWLNARYTGKKGYTPIAENGKPGTVTSCALVTGLQIELGIAEPTGFFGDGTKKAFDTQVGSLKVGSEDSGGKAFVTLLQHSMFCKGYHPGSVSGKFGDNTSAGILKLKADAGFQNNGSSEVNSMWMKAVTNSDAYTLVSGGGATIRQAQMYLNRNYYNYFGIKPCDGHYSRETNQAVIYGWQAEEGLDTNTANGRFGPTTKRLCPNLPNDSRYSNETLSRFIMIFQFTLYFNKCEYVNFTGAYDIPTISAVKSFQEFMHLPKNDGYADVGTSMSLMVSTGDPDRSAQGCDCATKLDTGKAQSLYNAGYRYVGRYLTNVPGGRDKRMDFNELSTISSCGLRTFPIFQQGGEDKDHFSEAQGRIDCDRAVTAAQELVLPQGTIIYFAVDYDFMDVEVTNKVIPYFLGVVDRMQKEHGSFYKIGIYGSRNICTRTYEVGFTESSFVSDMSTGYSGNYGYPMPTNWAFDQFCEYTFNGEFGLDKDAVSGRDQGVNIATKYTYNRSAARAYMERWHNDRNPDYYKYSADCANFVSQCLFAGGVPMNDYWFSRKYDGVNYTAELNEQNSSDKLDDINLQCVYDKELGSSFVVGAAWRLSKEQYNHFSNTGLGYINGEVITVRSADQLASVIQRCKQEGNPIQVGDLMYQSNSDKPMHHATIVSSISDTMIKYSAHTENRLDHDATALFENGEWINIVRIKDSNN